MAKKIYYYKFLIKLERKLEPFEIEAIKRNIWAYLGDISILDIQGGVANNNGYHKFKTKRDETKRGKNGSTL